MLKILNWVLEENHIVLTSLLFTVSQIYLIVSFWYFDHNIWVLRIGIEILQECTELGKTLLNNTYIDHFCNSNKSL